MPRKEPVPENPGCPHTWGKCPNFTGPHSCYYSRGHSGKHLCAWCGTEG